MRFLVKLRVFLFRNRKMTDIYKEAFEFLKTKELFNHENFNSHSKIFYSNQNWTYKRLNWGLKSELCVVQDFLAWLTQSLTKFPSGTVKKSFFAKVVGHSKVDRLEPNGTYQSNLVVGINLDGVGRWKSLKSLELLLSWPSTFNRLNRLFLLNHHWPSSFDLTLFFNQ